MPCLLAKPCWPSAHRAGYCVDPTFKDLTIYLGLNQELLNPLHVASSRSSIRPIQLSWSMLQRANDADSKGEKGSVQEPLAPSSALASPSAWFFLYNPLCPFLVSHILTWSPHSTDGPSHSMDLEFEWRRRSRGRDEVDRAEHVTITWASIK